MESGDRRAESGERRAESGERRAESGEQRGCLRSLRRRVPATDNSTHIRLRGRSHTLILSK